MASNDIQKVMENASAIFTEFANILKDNKKEDCELCNGCIEDLVTNLPIYVFCGMVPSPLRAN